MTQVELPDFKPFVGQHCETVASGTLLRAAGVELSEPMMFGLGEGLGFIIIKLNTLPLPFLGGRSKPFALTLALFRNLDIDCAVLETSSRARAWSGLESSLRAGSPVGLQLDSFYLEYFSQPVHFAGHCVAAYGCDDSHVMLVDTAQQGTVQRATRAAVEKARFAKGPMAARARAWTLSKQPDLTGLPKALRTAIRANAREYLAPPFTGASYLGIRQLAASVPKWLELAQRPEEDLKLCALLMERAGTGGALFRNFYRDFLREAKEHIDAATALDEAHGLFADSARRWTHVAKLIDSSARTGQGAHLREAADHCRQIADTEVAAMKILARV